MSNNKAETPFKGVGDLGQFRVRKEICNFGELSLSLAKLPHDARTAESITTFWRHLKPHL
jgi:hypothetical protein